ncbi:hypothetical protein [Amycolatopsis albispora]|uniref:PqqD family protein n=1 Tax=Amycolatopsis albispora TaxID=1804986 RepID=A0A344L3B2_9PSEU|nr:hypothetical protein [Amycolatopsis albispora]AXB42536.1 hypothetical protein A4R43_08345 [Amycolatopsis albispora]
MTVLPEDTTRSATGVRALREQTLHRLRTAMTEVNGDGAQRCAERLLAVLPKRRLQDNAVLVAYGGGKDSSYSLAFCRAVQLMVYAEKGETFRLRTVTNRHAGMPRAVMENIDRAYRALRIPEDPDCEALLVDGDEVKPFRAGEALAPQVVARNRVDLLMTGHRTFAEPRPTFCNACNLSMVNSFGAAAAYNGGVDVIITGDSPAEQRSYYLWVNRLARSYGENLDKTGESGFRRFLEKTDDLARAYFTDIFGPDAEAEIDRRRVTHDVPRELRFFSIYDDTRYSASEHWNLLNDYLGFVFDDLAFSFTESDCGTPTIMAHLRGLKCERLYRRSYRDGLGEYVEFALNLMRRKEFPERLIDTMRERYAGDHSGERMRAKANAFALDAFGLTEQQLICMVHSPFPGRGERLEAYLEAEQPDLLPRVADIHELLGAPDAEPGGELAERLERCSGLGLDWLRTLYRSPAPRPAGLTGGKDLMGEILAGDPHKAVIPTRHTPDGPVVHELISGR